MLSEVLDPYALLVVLAAAAALFFALRDVHSGLGAFFLTVLVLGIVSVPAPGSAGLAHIRVIDTLIGAGLALATGSSLRLAGYAGLLRPPSVPPRRGGRGPFDGPRGPLREPQP